MPSSTSNLMFRSGRKRDFKINFESYHSKTPKSFLLLQF
jgi:hypothetical protein